MTSPPTPTLNDNTASHPLLLSALQDGECSAQDAQQLVAVWRTDAVAKAAWHRHHLIGDVLRSDTMAQATAVDDAFLARLRLRLDQEPAIAAPHALTPARVAKPGTAQRWLMGGAIAAGFAAVAGVLVVSRLAVPGTDTSSSWFAAGGVTPGAQRASIGAPDAAGPVDPMNAALIRDAQIDRYLRAHRDMRGNATAALPGGALRSVDTLVPQR